MRRIISFILTLAFVVGSICLINPKQAHAAGCNGHHSFGPASSIGVTLNGKLSYNATWTQYGWWPCNQGNVNDCPLGHTSTNNHANFTNIIVNGAPKGGGAVVNAMRINVSGSVTATGGGRSYNLTSPSFSIPVSAVKNSFTNVGLFETASTGTIALYKCSRCGAQTATWYSGNLSGTVAGLPDGSTPVAIPDLSITLKDIYMKENGNRIECETSASGTPLVVPDRDIYFVSEITNADKDITAPIDVTASGMSGGLSITSTSKLINCSAAAPFEVDDTREVTFVGRIQNTGQNLFAFDVCVNEPVNEEIGETNFDNNSVSVNIGLDTRPDLVIECVEARHEDGSVAERGSVNEYLLYGGETAQFKLKITNEGYGDINNQFMVGASTRNEWLRLELLNGLFGYTYQFSPNLDMGDSTYVWVSGVVGSVGNDLRALTAEVDSAVGPQAMPYDDLIDELDETNNLAQIIFKSVLPPVKLNISADADPSVVYEGHNVDLSAVVTAEVPDGKVVSADITRTVTAPDGSTSEAVIADDTSFTDGGRYTHSEPYAPPVVGEYTVTYALTDIKFVDAGIAPERLSFSVKMYV